MPKLSCLKSLPHVAALALGLVLAVAAPSAAAAGRRFDTVRPEVKQQVRAAGRAAVIVVMREPDAAALAKGSRKVAISAATDALLARLPSGEISAVRRFEALPLVALTAGPRTIERLGADPRVVAVALDQVRQLARIEGGALIQLPALVALGYRGEGQVIAVVDSGIDYFHPELGTRPMPNDKVIGGWDFVDLDDDPAPGEDASLASSHGTSVAGIIAGSAAGIASAAKLVSLRACDDGGCPDSLVIQAIDWAVSRRSQYGITVINLSLQGGRYSNRCNAQEPAYSTAIRAAVGAGILVVAAAGNSGFLDALAAPACIEEVVSVGAVYDGDVGSRTSCLDDLCATTCTDAETAADMVSCYSNSAGFMSIYAPANCAWTPRLQGGTTGCFGGTSAAAAYASGGAAVLLSAIGPRTPAQLRDLMRTTGVPRTDPKSGRSAPRLDLLKVYQAVNGGGGTCASGAANVSYVPGAANIAGVAPAYFVTDLHVFNPSYTAPITVSASFLETGKENVDPACAQFTVTPRQEVAYTNVLGTLLARTGAGAMRLSATGPYLATSSTYDNSGEGTFGQYLPVIPLSRAATRGIVMHLSNSAAFRSNVGIVNTNSTPALVFLNLYDGDARLLGTGSVQVKANSHFQANTIFSYLGAGTVQTTRAYLELASSQPFIAYGSIVDNVSNDPIAIIAQDDLAP